MRNSTLILILALAAIATSAGAPAKAAQADKQSGKTKATGIAKSKSKSKIGASSVKPPSGVSTDVVFDGTFVNGQYHSSGEAVSTVETEKTLNNLIGLRADFKDRLQTEKSRLKQAGR